MIVYKVVFQKCFFEGRKTLDIFGACGGEMMHIVPVWGAFVFALGGKPLL